jgi:hypothetical protein
VTASLQVGQTDKNASGGKMSSTEFDLLRVHLMSRSKSIKNQFDYDPEGFWICTWQDKHGSGGNLESCLDMVGNCIDIDECNIDDVRYQLLKYGNASGFWWSIWHESNLEGDEIDEEEDYSAQESLCFFIKIMINKPMISTETIF